VLGVGHRDHVGLLLGLSEGLVGELRGLLRLLLKERGIKGRRDLLEFLAGGLVVLGEFVEFLLRLAVNLLVADQLLLGAAEVVAGFLEFLPRLADCFVDFLLLDRKSTRLNSSH
jgi:hypothetical protein